MRTKRNNTASYVFVPKSDRTKHTRDWILTVVLCALMLPLGVWILVKKLKREKDWRKKNGRVLLIAGGIAFCLGAVMLSGVLWGRYDLRETYLRDLAVTITVIAGGFAILLPGAALYVRGSREDRIGSLVLEKKIRSLEDMHLMLQLPLASTCDYTEQMLHEQLLPGMEMDYRGRCLRMGGIAGLPEGLQGALQKTLPERVLNVCIGIGAVSVCLLVFTGFFCLSADPMGHGYWVLYRLYAWGAVLGAAAVCFRWQWDRSRLRSVRRRKLLADGRFSEEEVNEYCGLHSSRSV